MFYRLRRKSNLLWDRTFHHIDARSLQAMLREVGVQPGMSVCVHSALSRVGYFDGGPRMIMDTLMQAVGPDGTLLMPSFPTNGTMKSWVENGEVFDVRVTPSAVGALTELFRTAPGVQRSMHPTHPLAGSGRNAADLLRDHEKSLTPYGYETPYGRMAERDDTYILMISTQVLSLLHHLQERVDFPNLFLPGEHDAAYVDYQGERRVMRTRVLRPRLPYSVAIPSVAGAEPDWTLLHDYTLMFPRIRETMVKDAGYRFDGFPIIYRRREQLAAANMLKIAKCGRSEIGLLHVRPFIKKFEVEFAELIERFRTYYDVDAIAARKLPFL